MLYMLYIDILDNSLFVVFFIFICPFETDDAFEGGNKYYRSKHKMSRWMDDLRFYVLFNSIYVISGR